MILLPMKTGNYSKVHGPGVSAKTSSLVNGARFRGGFEASLLWRCSLWVLPLPWKGFGCLGYPAATGPPAQNRLVGSVPRELPDMDETQGIPWDGQGRRSHVAAGRHPSSAAREDAPRCPQAATGMRLSSDLLLAHSRVYSGMGVRQRNVITSPVFSLLSLAEEDSSPLPRALVRPGDGAVPPNRPALRHTWALAAPSC